MSTLTEFYADKLKEIIYQIQDIENRPRFSSEFKSWKSKTERLLKNAFPEDDTYLKKFQNIAFSSLIGIGNSRLISSRMNSEYNRIFYSGLEKSKLFLEEILDDYTYSELNKSTKSNEISTKLGDEIFIVHGHDNEAKQETARFIEKLGLKVVILHERPNRGRTIIEKLEQESKNAGYAIILLTPDDIGYLKGKDSEPEERARQNVVLELGYFLGKLKRERVCVLLKDSADIPGDFSGVLYIPMDSAGKWKYDLSKEMNEVGFGIDLNAIN